MKEFLSKVIEIIIGISVMLVLCYPVMLLWNSLIPTIFGLPELSYQQTLGLYVLCEFFFKLKL